MKVPLEWLREFVDPGLKADRLADRLTMAGSEISAIEFHGKGIEGIVVGKIKSIEPHQRSNDLLVLQVDIGAKLLQIVTNVKTLKAGDKVPVALRGANLAKDIRVENRELHGIESFGMLCSLEHLGLADSSSDVLHLDKDASVGADIKNVLGVKGTILEIDVLPNRGDLLSILGVAREVAAVLGKKLRTPTFKLKETGEGIRSRVTVSVKEADLCPRYMARVIEGIKIGESPAWIRDRLISCGLRPINNVVDITNYCLLEMGQPLHAFDLCKLQGGIVVRPAKEKEEIATLDGEKRVLNPECLVISDEKRAIAIAGVMGGANTEVGSGTTSLVLESAYFKPASINKTSQYLKLRTEASIRFDKGVDWEGVERALDRAAALITECAGGVILKGVIDVKGKDRVPKVIPVAVSNVNAVLGTDLSSTQVAAVLKRLGFGVKALKHKLSVTVPTCRAGDIEREIDVIEEAARIFGYDKISSEMPGVNYSPSKQDVLDAKIDSIMLSLANSGFFEAQTFSLISPKESAMLGALGEGAISITNPLSEDTSVLRTMLSPSLVKAITYNISRQAKDIALFEVGKVYRKDGPEKLKLALAVCGNVFEESFQVSGAEQLNFYFLKGAIENVLETLGTTGHSFDIGEHPMLKGGMACRIMLGKDDLGFLGRLSDDLRKEYDVLEEIFIAEIDLEALLKTVPKEKRFKQIAKYPKVSRDIAMFVPQSVSNAAILAVVKRAGAPILENVGLFDRYKGKQVPEGQVSLAYRLDYRDPTRTLTDKDVAAKHEEVLKALTEELGISVRKQ